MPRIDRLWWDLDADTAALTQGLQGQMPVMGRFASLMRVGPVAAVAALGAVSAAVASQSVRAFARFDDKLQKSLAIMGDVSQTMRQDMATAARLVARETSFTADQAAQSFFYLASAGFNAAESLKALPIVAQFAQAGMFDMALATDLLTDAQSALGLKTGDLSQDMQSLALVSDVLVKANTLANATVQQFSEALTNQAGPALKAAQVDLEEGVAVLAAFADQGIKGAEAGTKLNILLRDLQTKALQNKTAFAELGVTVFDNAGNFQNIADVIEDLENAMVGLNDEQRKATLLNLGFADRSVITIQAILGASQSIRDYEKALRDAGGTTEEVARKNLATLSEQSKLLGSDFKELALRIGGTLAPAVSDLVAGMRGLFDIILGTRELLAQFQPAVSTIQSLGNIPNLAETTGGIERLRDAFESMQEAAREGKLGDVFADLSSEQLDRLRQGMIRGLSMLRAQGQAPLDRRALFDQIIADLETRISATRQIEAKARQEEREAAAENARQIALEDLRVAVELGNAKKEVLLSRLREELARTEEGTEARRELLLEIRDLEKSIDDDAQERIERRREAEAAVRDYMVDSTKTMVDNMELELERFAEKWQDVWDELPEAVQEQLLKVAALWREHIETIRFIEPLEEEIENLASWVGRIFSEETVDTRAVEAIQQRLAEARGEVESELEAHEGNAAAVAALEAILQRIITLERRISGEVKDQQEETQKRTKIEQKADQDRQRAFRQTVNEIERAADAGLKFAESMGLVDSETAKVLSNIIDIGSGIAQIAGGNIIGGGLQILGGLAGLFGGGGESEQSKIYKENTRAIRELSRNFMKVAQTFLANVTGKDFLIANTALRRLANRISGGQAQDILNLPAWRRVFGGRFNVEEFRSMGIDLSSVIEQAKSLGITFEDELNPTLRELQMAARAFAEVDLSRWTQTFQGQMDLLQREFDIFDITDPVVQFERMRDAFLANTQLSDALAQQLREIDPTTAEGRAAINRILQELFMAFTEMDFSMFGQLSATEFLDMLSRLEGSLDTLDDTLEDAGQVNQFAIDRSITEITGQRIADIMTTTAYWSEITAQNTARIVELMGGASFMPPPVSGAGMITPGAGMVFNITVNVQVPAGTDPETAGTIIGQSVVRHLDQAFADRGTDVIRVSGGELEYT